jgi:drug/metabolite transporter (DMT)-like permease
VGPDGQAKRKKKYYTEPLWWCGLLAMVVSSLLSILVFRFLGQSRASIMASITIVYNCAMAAVFLGERFTAWDALVTAVILTGAATAVVFGSSGASSQPTNDLASVVAMLSRTVVLVTGLVAAAMWVAAFLYVRRLAAKGKSRTPGEVRLECYLRVIVLSGIMTGTSGLLASSVVKSIGGAAREGSAGAVFSSPPFLLMLAALPCSLVLQVGWLNSALAQLDALEVVPVFQSAVIVIGLLTGIILTGDAQNSTAAGLALFLVGCGISCCGVLLLSLKARMVPRLDALWLRLGWAWCLPRAVAAAVPDEGSAETIGRAGSSKARRLETEDEGAAIIGRTCSGVDTGELSVPGGPFPLRSSTSMRGQPLSPIPETGPATYRPRVPSESAFTPSARLRLTSGGAGGGVGADSDAAASGGEQQQQPVTLLPPPMLASLPAGRPRVSSLERITRLIFAAPADGEDGIDPGAWGFVGWSGGSDPTAWDAAAADARAVEGVAGADAAQRWGDAAAAAPAGPAGRHAARPSMIRLGGAFSGLAASAQLYAGMGAGSGRRGHRLGASHVPDSATADEQEEEGGGEEEAANEWGGEARTSGAGAAPNPLHSSEGSGLELTRQASGRRTHADGSPDGNARIGMGAGAAGASSEGAGAGAHAIRQSISRSGVPAFDFSSYFGGGGGGSGAASGAPAPAAAHGYGASSSGGNPARARRLTVDNYSSLMEVDASSSAMVGTGFSLLSAIGTLVSDLMHPEPAEPAGPAPQAPISAGDELPEHGGASAVEGTAGELFSGAATPVLVPNAAAFAIADEMDDLEAPPSVGASAAASRASSAPSSPSLLPAAAPSTGATPPGVTSPPPRHGRPLSGRFSLSGPGTPRLSTAPLEGVSQALSPIREATMTEAETEGDVDTDAGDGGTGTASRCSSRGPI